MARRTRASNNTATKTVESPVTVTFLEPKVATPVKRKPVQRPKPPTSSGLTVDDLVPSMRKPAIKMAKENGGTIVVLSPTRFEIR